MDPIEFELVKKITHPLGQVPVCIRVILSNTFSPSLDYKDCTEDALYKWYELIYQVQ